MPRERTAEQLKRLGERRFTTAVILVASVYALVALCTLGVLVGSIVWVFAAIF
jgi:nitrate reductase NapE component